MAVPGSQLRTGALATSQPLYAPAALRTFANNLHNPTSVRNAVHIKRFQQRLNVHTKNEQPLDNCQHLHPHFCTCLRDCHLVAHDGIHDVRDAVSSTPIFYILLN